MSNNTWKVHLSSWKCFLEMLLDSTEDEVQSTKYNRQIRTIEKVRCGAVLNPSLISEFIEPIKEYTPNYHCEKYFFDLNDTQKKAVNTSLAAKNISLIQGPPGTGKTQVIAEICLQLLNKHPDIRILVCSETHVAVNNLLLRISPHSNNIRIVRIRNKDNDELVNNFSPEKIIESYKKWLYRNVKNKELIEIIEDEFSISSEIDTRKQKQIEKILSLSANIVGMTCNRTAAYDFEDTAEMFDIVILDEVCKATLPEILAPLTISKKAILIGDPKQLPPVFCSEEQDIINKIENCELNKFMYIDSLFMNKNTSVLLDTQYRMSNQIGNMISDLFYNGILKNGRNKNIQDSLLWINYELTKQWPIINNSETPSIYNKDEVIVINKLIQKLKKNNPQSSIAVISPYRGQVRELRKSLLGFDNVKIDTVDGFQGKECDIVIFSITRTYGPYRFLADYRRLNVALSRAKDYIYIIGQIDYAKNNKLIKKIINYFKIINLSEL